MYPPFPPRSKYLTTHSPFFFSFSSFSLTARVLLVNFFSFFLSGKASVKPSLQRKQNREKRASSSALPRGESILDKRGGGSGVFLTYCRYTYIRYFFWRVGGQRTRGIVCLYFEHGPLLCNAELGDGDGDVAAPGMAEPNPLHGGCRQPWLGLSAAGLTRKNRKQVGTYITAHGVQLIDILFFTIETDSRFHHPAYLSVHSTPHHTALA